MPLQVFGPPITKHKLKKSILTGTVSFFWFHPKKPNPKIPRPKIPLAKTSKVYKTEYPEIPKAKIPKIKKTIPVK